MYKISRLALLARNDRKVVGWEDRTVAISGMKKPLFVPESLKTAISGTKQPVFMPELSSLPPPVILSGAKRSRKILYTFQLSSLELTQSAITAKR